MFAGSSCSAPAHLRSGLIGGSASSKKRPVCDWVQAAISSGVPSMTIRPPSSSPSRVFEFCAPFASQSSYMTSRHRSMAARASRAPRRGNFALRRLSHERFTQSNWDHYVRDCRRVESDRKRASPSTGPQGEARRVAVGTPVAGRPPQRSVRVPQLIRLLPRITYRLGVSPDASFHDRPAPHNDLLAGSWPWRGRYRWHQ